MIPSTRCSTARVASSAVMIPFRTIGRDVSERSQAMSFQVTAGSRSSATYLANAEPRSDAGTPSSPAGRTFAMLRPGGSVNAFRSSFSRRPRSGGSTGRRDLPLRMDEPVERGRRDQDRHRDPLAEDRRRGVSPRHIDEDSGSQSPLGEGLAVPTEGDLILRPAGDVVE